MKECIIDESTQKMVEDAVREKEALKDDFCRIEAAIRAEERSGAEEVASPVDVPDKVRNSSRVRRMWLILGTVAAAACLACGIFFRVSDVLACMDAGFDISVAELAMTSRGDSHADEIISAMEADDISGARNLITDFRSMPEPVFDLSGEAGQYRFELYKAECQLVDYLDAVLLMREGRPLKARKALRTVAASGGYYASAAEEVLDRLR